jgi:hypothetical protein
LLIPWQIYELFTAQYLKLGAFDGFAKLQFHSN